MDRTAVYDSYWKFAAERHLIYERRLADDDGPWTDDQVLSNYRFTNTFRAADRVSQYLIKSVQYDTQRSQDPKELFFRTMMFKLFNKIETWELLERALGPLDLSVFNQEKISSILTEALSKGVRIYSAAYIMPPPALGYARKHENHLELLATMIRDNLPLKILKAKSLKSVYEQILAYPGIGPFLAFQFAIDLNYSELLDFDEADFVVAGPGALDGISKCFRNTAHKNPEEIICRMVDIQDQEFSRLGLKFNGLFGRRLQPIDCQNIFCEISKYARVAHPEIAGLSGRVRIKQTYRPNISPIIQPYFPPRWRIKVPTLISVQSRQRLGTQGLLFG
ncbi:MAG: nucleotide kinase domain-containing protein [Pseudomonadota bacterium]